MRLLAAAGSMQRGLEMARPGAGSASDPQLLGRHHRRSVRLEVANVRGASCDAFGYAA
jgi:hypothetical protein